MAGGCRTSTPLPTFWVPLGSWGGLSCSQEAGGECWLQVYCCGSGQAAASPHVHRQGGRHSTSPTRAHSMCPWGPGQCPAPLWAVRGHPGQPLPTMCPWTPMQDGGVDQTPFSLPRSPSWGTALWERSRCGGLVAMCTWGHGGPSPGPSLGSPRPVGSWLLVAVAVPEGQSWVPQGPV